MEHLNFLIGPKLYEANWLDLQRDGHTPTCSVWRSGVHDGIFEVSFQRSSRQASGVVLQNPKVMACQYLMQFHEQQRKDKIIVFRTTSARGNTLPARRPLITATRVTRAHASSTFKFSNEINTIFLSKVGDNSIRHPRRNVIIQIVARRVSSAGSATSGSHLAPERRLSRDGEWKGGEGECR